MFSHYLLILSFIITELAQYSRILALSYITLPLSKSTLHTANLIYREESGVKRNKERKRNYARRKHPQARIYS